MTSHIQEKLDKVFPFAKRVEKLDKIKEFNPSSVCMFVFFGDDDFRLWNYCRDQKLSAVLYNARKKNMLDIKNYQSLTCIIEKTDVDGVVNHIMPSGGSTLGELEERYSNIDGYLYLVFNLENVFG